VSSNPRISALAPYVLYETLGPSLPHGAAAATLWGLAHRCAMTYPDAVRRAGHADGEALFGAILDGRSGITFTLDGYDDVWSYVARPEHRIALAIPELIDELQALVGERRANTANTIIRDPDWRKRDRDGALRISPEDAVALGLSFGGRNELTSLGWGDPLAGTPWHKHVPLGSAAAG
jgi:hypothetical protein